MFIHRLLFVSTIISLFIFENLFNTYITRGLRETLVTLLRLVFYNNSKNDSNFVAALHMVQKEENQKAVRQTYV